MENINIYEKLSNIQAQLKASKNQWNKFGRYYYRNCEDILEAVKPLCFKNRTTLTLKDEVTLIGNRYYIKAYATLQDWDSDKNIVVEAIARESDTKKGMDDCQITGTASSYARKYALNGLFNIDDSKDSDTNENKTEKEEREKEAKKNKNNHQDEQEDKKATFIMNYYINNKDTFRSILKEKLGERTKVTELTEKEKDDLISLIKTLKGE